MVVWREDWKDEWSIPRIERGTGETVDRPMRCVAVLCFDENENENGNGNENENGMKGWKRRMRKEAEG